MRLTEALSDPEMATHLVRRARPTVCLAHRPKRSASGGSDPGKVS